jgi:hypothetical protein
MAKTFTYSAIVSLNTRRELAIEYTDACDDFANEMMEEVQKIFADHREPHFIVVGTVQYKMLMAYFSRREGKAIELNAYQGIPIVVLNQEHYFDVILSASDAFAKIIVREGNDV